MSYMCNKGRVRSAKHPPPLPPPGSPSSSISHGNMAYRMTGGADLAHDISQRVRSLQHLRVHVG